MASRFQVMQPEGYVVDLDDILMRREYLTDGTLWLCGGSATNSGLLGTNNSSNYSSPVTTSGGGTNWKQVSSTGWHSAAIKSDGTLWTWGNNNYGDLGTNDTINKASPVTTSGGGTNWKQISASFHMSAAVKTDGTLWVWGNNGSGQLGTNNTTNYSSPVTTSGGGTNWKNVFVYSNNTGAGQLFGIKTDGTLWCCGTNSGGVLGTNDTTAYSSPVTVSGGGTNWKQISSDGNSTFGLKSDGTLWVWGNNGYGQLGTNSTINYSSPVTVSGGGTNWKQISTGRGIKTDGTLWVWGYNSSGQLGTNSTISYSSPVTVSGGGTNWKQVSLYSAIKTDGTLWVWGTNTYGALGTNNVSSYSSPVTTVLGGNTWKFVSSGFVTAALTDITF